MKFTSDFWSVGRSHAAPGLRLRSPHVLESDPAGGWDTTISPVSGSLKRLPSRLTSTRWPIWSVGTIDSLGIRYGLTRKAWMPRASPRATTTMTTSSTNELPAERSFLASPVEGLTLGLLVVGVRPSLGGGRVARLLGGGSPGRVGLRPADDLVERRTLGVNGAIGGGCLGLELRERIVQQARLDDLFG